MPNGVDKHLQRLLMACALYRQRYSSWPSQARFGSVTLWNLANLLDAENFARLSAHLELRTSDKEGISVGGIGVVNYGEGDTQIDSDTLAERWLGVEVRHEER
jgi:hypothetical protein